MAIAICHDTYKEPPCTDVDGLWIQVAAAQLVGHAVLVASLFASVWNTNDDVPFVYLSPPFNFITTLVALTSCFWGPGGLIPLFMHFSKAESCLPVCTQKCHNAHVTVRYNLWKAHPCSPTILVVTGREKKAEPSWTLRKSTICVIFICGLFSGLSWTANVRNSLLTLSVVWDLASVSRCRVGRDGKRERLRLRVHTVNLPTQKSWEFPLLPLSNKTVLFT